MSMRLLVLLLPLWAGLLASCGRSDKPAAVASATAATPAPAARPADVSTWQPADLSKTSALIPVLVNVPAGAKLEKNGNGGVDILLTDKAMLTVSALAVSSLKEARSSDEHYLLKNEMYPEAKKVVSDPNGFVYTRRMKTEANGTAYEPESHFVYYLETPGGSVYSISGDRSMAAMSGPGCDYPEAQAKAQYQAVKQSARVK